MPTIHYKFADGHTEEIEVTEAIAAVFEQLEKYERAVPKNIIKHKSDKRRLLFKTVAFCMFLYMFTIAGY